MKHRLHHSALALMLGSAALWCAAAGVQAQTIYRIVGADGKVTFSDKPPVSSDQGKVAGTGVGANAAASSSTALPFELRQVVAKYPVTLYTSAKCAPCDVGRALLISRGVPFNERTVTTAEDTESLQRISGENSLPFLTIGGQRIKGMSDSEWTQYLDAAGYPKTSQLPASYKNTAPAPLVSLQKPAPPPKAEEKTAAPNTARQPAANPANPAGIQF
ncbi:MAG: glutaredoxin family protein [Rhodoferax sp.]|nr:glutaredoxin family protein [Rhodoferax sp.]MDP3651245.1 glutaredoxin family protein [Rhodoferax sp.]